MADVMWGLDIGDWSIKITRGSFDKRSGKIRVDLFDTIRYGDLPCGYEAETLEKYREGVRAFGERHAVGKGEGLCVSIPGNEVFSRFINLPPVPERLHEIIRYEARQQIPFDIDLVVWDYQPVKDHYELGEEIQVGLFALKGERVNDFVEMLRPWEKNLRIVQDAPLAVYNFLRFEGRADQPIIVLDVGAHSTDVIVLNHPRFWIRPLVAGGDNITAALKENFGINSEEAERIKDRVGRTGHEAQILRAVRPVVDNLVSEIQRSLGYYKSMDRAVKFERVLLLGNAFKLSGLDRILAEGLQYEIEKLTELRRFELAPSVDRAGFLKELPGACSALGLLVQGFQQSHMKINLVPEEVVLREEVRRKKPWALASAAATVLIAVAFIVSEHIYGTELGQGANIGQSVLEQISKNESEYASAQAQTEEIKAELEDLAVGGMERDFFLRFIPLLSSAMPEQVYVTDLRFEWKEPSEVRALEYGRGAVPGAGMPFGGPGMPGGMPGEMPGGMPGGVPGGMPGGVPAGGPTEVPGAGGFFGPPGMGPIGPEGAMMGPQGFPGMGYARGALKSSESKLVMAFSCESTVVKRGLDFIEQNVIERLKNLKFPGGQTPIFEEVKLTAGPTDVFRSSVDGRVVSERGVLGRTTRSRRTGLKGPETGYFGPGAEAFAGPGAEGFYGPEAFRRPQDMTLEAVQEKRLHFVAFSGYAVFKMGEKRPEEAKPVRPERKM